MKLTNEMKRHTAKRRTKSVLVVKALDLYLHKLNALETHLLNEANSNKKEMAPKKLVNSLLKSSLISLALTIQSRSRNSRVSMI